MNNLIQKILIDGPIGKIELAIDEPKSNQALRGLCLVAHPHPLFGGTLDNKVAQTLARTFTELGYVALRPNFRGVGQTAGQHNEGPGEQDDLIAVLEWAQQQAPWAELPLVLAGFSFGTFVQSHVAKRLQAQGSPPVRLVFVGTATTNWEVAPVPENTLLIHGDQDETIPLKSMLEWATPQEIPVIVIPGADHFFHRKLHLIRRIIQEAWKA